MDVMMMDDEPQCPAPLVPVRLSAEDAAILGCRVVPCSSELVAQYEWLPPAGIERPPVLLYTAEDYARHWALEGPR